MFDRCVADVTRRGSVRNPYAVCAKALKAPRRSRRRRNPAVRVTRVRRFVLLATLPGQPGALIWTGSKLANRGKPVLFATADSAKLVAKFLRLQYPTLRRYAFHARPT